MQIRSIAIFMYSLDHNVIIIMQSNVDANQMNSNFQVFFRPQCNFGIVVIQSVMDLNQIDSNFQVFFKSQFHYHYCSYAIQCRCKSDE